MNLVPAFEWRRLTRASTVEYRVTERGELAVRGFPVASDGSNVTRPPFEVVSFYEWRVGRMPDEWILRTSGPPLTMQRIHACFYGLCQAASDRLGVDERILLTTIACESGRDPRHPSGRDVRSPRTEIGYPDRTGEQDLGDGARDAVDWQRYVSGASPTTHSSHGLMQTLISTAVSACPHFFRARQPEVYRTILWDPGISIECGATHLSHFPAADKLDPLRARFRYGAGQVYIAKNNRWGARMYEFEGVPAEGPVVLNWIAFWNDLRAVLSGEAPNARQAGFVAVGVLLTLASTAISLAAAYLAVRR